MMDGRGGLDYADYRNVTTSITVDLSNPLNNSVGSHAEGDHYISIEGIRGGSADDVLIGDASGNFLRGMLGADMLDGGAGSDWADYNNATTALVVDLANSGNNTGEATGDQFISIENLRGGAFDDLLRGDGNGNAFRGEAGNDTFEGGAGNDRAIYAFGTFAASDFLSGAITVNLAAGTITGDATVGTDTLISIEMVRGSNVADTYIATGFGSGSTNAGNSGSFNEFEGMGGDDTVTGNGSTQLSFAYATGAVAVDMQAGTAVGDTSVGHDTFT